MVISLKSVLKARTYLVLYWSLEFRIDDVSTVGHYKHPDPVGFGRAPDIAPLHISPLSRRVEGARHVDEGFSICRARGNDAKQVVLKAIMVQCIVTVTYERRDESTWLYNIE